MQLPTFVDPRALLNRLVSTFWFLPTILTALLIGLAITLTVVDRGGFEPGVALGWLLYGGDAGGARSLLTAVAGSMITVVSVTFSMIVVALTVSSQHFGPRLLSNFMRDKVAQVVLGVFVGTFGYCLVVLRSIFGEGQEDGTTFVPHLATTGAVVLTLASMGALIYYVHHVAMSMQVSEITASVTRDLERTVDRVYPERIGEEPEAGAAVAMPEMPADAVALRARGSGYVRELSDERLLRQAQQRDVIVWLQARPGDFVVEGATIAYVTPPPVDTAAFECELWRSFVIGADRTSYHDAAFCVQQLVEVALRALSPGVNEPFTAVTCIDRLGQGLAKLAGRRIPSAVRVGTDRRPRVVTQPRTLSELVAPAFEPLALYADRNRGVFERLLSTLRLLHERARRAEDRAAIDAVVAFVRRARDERGGGRGEGPPPPR